MTNKMNFTQIFNKLQSNIHKIEKDEFGYWIDYVDFSTGKNKLVIDTKYTYKNIIITIDCREIRRDKKTEVMRETKLFYNNKEIELTKTTAHKLINLLR